MAVQFWYKLRQNSEILDTCTTAATGTIRIQLIGIIPVINWIPRGTTVFTTKTAALTIIINGTTIVGLFE